MLEPATYLEQVRAHSPKLPPKELLNAVEHAPIEDKEYSWGDFRDMNCDFRETVLKLLYRDFTIADLNFIRFLFDQVKLARCDYSCFGDNLLASFMLFELGQAEDAFRIFSAKFDTDFDSAIAIDGIAMFGAGIHETIDYVKASNHAARQMFLDYVEKDFLPSNEHTVESYRKSMQHYFGAYKK